MIFIASDISYSYSSTDFSNGSWVAFSTSDYISDFSNSEDAWVQEKKRRMKAGIASARKRHARKPVLPVMFARFSGRYRREPRLSNNYLMRQEVKV